MKRFFSNVAGAGGFSVAAAVLVVGLVAAVSSAQQDTSPSVRTDAVTVTTDSVPDDAGDEVAPPGTDTPTTPEERLDLIESRLDQLDEFTSDLSDRSDDQDAITREYNELTDQVLAFYHKLCGLGVAKEQARCVLPFGTYSECVWTTSFQAVMHFLDLRLDPHAQQEVRAYAHAIQDLVKGALPVLYQCWAEEAEK